MSGQVDLTFSHSGEKGKPMIWRHALGVSHLNMTSYTLRAVLDPNTFDVCPGGGCGTCGLSMAYLIGLAAGDWSSPAGGSSAAQVGGGAEGRGAGRETESPVGAVGCRINGDPGPAFLSAPS